MSATASRSASNCSREALWDACTSTPRATSAAQIASWVEPGLEPAATTFAPAPASSNARYAVFASKAGAPTHPDWYHNLLAHPETTAEVGTETVPVHVRELTGDERTEVWEEQKRRYPGFAGYEKKTDRVIPVMLLAPR